MLLFKDHHGVCSSVGVHLWTCVCTFRLYMVEAILMMTGYWKGREGGTVLHLACLKGIVIIIIIIIISLIPHEQCRILGYYGSPYYLQEDKYMRSGVCSDGFLVSPFMYLDNLPTSVSLLMLYFQSRSCSLHCLVRSSLAQIIIITTGISWRVNFRSLCNTVECRNP